MKKQILSSTDCKLLKSKNQVIRTRSTSTMSGRGRGGRSSYRGRGRGKGGRGNSRNSGKHNKEPQRKTLADYIYKVGGPRQSSDCIKITKFLINHVRKTFKFGDDIGQALEDRAEITLTPPVLQVAPDNTAAELAVKPSKDKEFEMLYQAEIEAFIT